VPKKYLAIVSLMIATRGAVAASLIVNSRPATSDCWIVPKKSGPTPFTSGFMSSPSLAA